MLNEKYFSCSPEDIFRINDSSVFPISCWPTLLWASNLQIGWAKVAHVCNLTYSGGSDQEDPGLKPAWVRSYLEKNPTPKRAGGVAQGVGLEFKPQDWKKEATKQKTPCRLDTNVVL
jgi:hypothetical protein